MATEFSIVPSRSGAGFDVNVRDLPSMVELEARWNDMIANGWSENEIEAEFVQMMAPQRMNEDPATLALSESYVWTYVKPFDIVRLDGHPYMIPRFGVA
ncbi:hypothetical protein [Myxococcus phage Mx1]|nr:hypothetical protein [Myxococcus phage Mx1]